MNRLKYYSCIWAAALSFVGCTNNAEDGEANTVKEPTARQILQENGFRTGHISVKPIIKTFTVTGKVEAPPQSTAQVYPLVGAFVQEVFVIKGQEVKKGERLAAIRHQDILSLQQRYLSARNALEQNEADYRRKQELAEDQAVSSREVQRSRAEYLSAQSEVQSLATTLRNMDVNLARLSGENLQETIFLTAPIDGHILGTRAGVGQFAGSDEPLFTIVSNKHLHLELQIPPAKIDLVKAGQPIIFRTRTSGQKRDGEVYMVNQVANEMGFFVAHAHFSDSLQQMRPGSYAEVKVIYHTDTLPALPRTAVTEKAGKSYALAVEGEAFKEIPVLPGMSSDSLVAILNAEDLRKKEIVLNGVKYLVAAAQE